MFENRIIESDIADTAFRYFEQISKIPRGSGNESAIASYIVEFAKARDLECYKDEANNVLVRMTGSEGRENEEYVLLQGHTDMVCEKDETVIHDFYTDAIKLYIDNGYLKAKGTTLGADNGIAVAFMLAILDGEMKSHPPIECLFTAGEEIGMIGAGEFDFSLVKSRRMINMDSEAEGKVVASCAGGVRSEMIIPLSLKKAMGEGLRVTVGGLFGGHSGEDINKGRANANRLMGRLLTELSFEMDFEISRIYGGSKDNAIPRECTAEITVSDFYNALLAIEEISREINRELSGDDRDFFCKVEHCEIEKVMEKEASNKLLLAINHTYSGVIEMSQDVDGLVEWSSNLGVIETTEDNARLVFLTRSGMDRRIDYSIKLIDRFAETIGGSANHFGRYTGWSYAKTSPIREAYLEAYRTLFDKEATVEIIHAGLECGLIKANVPDMDIISIGPEIIALHSPMERLNIASAERLWTLVEYMLAKI